MRAYKVELDPNNKQSSSFARFCGAARFVYNWGLAEWKKQYESGLKPSAFGLKKQFNASKDEICPWIREVPYSVTEDAFNHLQTAFKNFFSKRSDYPKFKKRGQGSFSIKGFVIQNRRIRLQGAGWVVLKEREYIPLGANYGTYVTVSERAGRWYASVLVTDDEPVPELPSGVCLGIDFGLKHLAVLSDGSVFENPKPLRLAQSKLSKLQRELARRERGGENWKKTKVEIQRQYARVSNIRSYVLHKLSSAVIEKRPAIIVIEDLNVSGMVKNHSLALSISDVGFGELRRQIEYKAKRNGIKVIAADRWFPSSKMCSGCGQIKSDLSLSDRVYKCDCGVEIDRDLNAAINLAAYGLKAETQPD